MTRNQITLSGEIKEEYQTEAEEAKAGIYPNNEELSAAILSSPAPSLTPSIANCKVLY